MKQDLYVTIPLVCADNETVEVVQSGEEQHVIATLGESRNLVARVVPVNPPIPVGTTRWPPLSRMAYRSRQLVYELANAQPLEPKPKRRSRRLATT